MEPRPMTPYREQKRKRIEERIAAAAVRLFLEKGFAATSVQDIVREAEVSPRSFFRYFITKEGVLFRNHQARLNALEEALTQFIGKAEPFEGVYLALVSFAEEYETQRESLLQEWTVVVNTPSLAGKDMELDREYERVLARFLSDPRHLRPLRLERAPFFAGAIFGALRTVLFKWFEGGCQKSLAKMGAEQLENWLVTQKAGAAPRDWLGGK